MNDKERILIIIERLEELYPAAECELVYEGEPWKLLVMARLSAQCTDKRVNIVSEPLFERYPTVKAMADADITELEEIVKPCGLYKVKARNIIDSCKMIQNKFPDTMEDLLKLPGVGRKIANLILGDVFHEPAVVTDTHCIRLTNRFGFCKSENPLVVERTLVELVPPEKQSDFCHRLVWFGRDRCTARSPKCAGCPLADVCVSFVVK
ncbi:MAG: endonuclease III [Oscillospiraceae bacterium]|nr:endonuclease III [Oscillospiraceae bacterium]